MDISLLHILSLAAIVQALLMALFWLLNKNSPAVSNRILAAMLFILAAVSSTAVFKTMTPIQVHMRYHRQIFLIGQLAFLVGPLLYFYVKSLLELNFTFRKRDLLHLVPFVIAFAGSWLVFERHHPFIIALFPGRLVFSSCVLVQNILYVPACFSILRTAGLTPASFLSVIENAKLAWVRMLVVGYIVLWIMQLQVFMVWDAIVLPEWCPYEIGRAHV
jgi:hypothetical protein